ncbi:hypothetical protein Q5H92_26365 [Hymenobacter sp. M29]|uniref:Uncharacterized protein n=1 Tax=Hymenobacter mellowenesis TaxID=3063995 RepID=A0ABT9AJ57_9BACT|nr:hypothetical protein [Hymenobacter sp. M29]MDO7849911.1 hypothetical protein [Hymenobacter sp. M29]
MREIRIKETPAAMFIGEPVIHIGRLPERWPEVALAPYSQLRAAMAANSETGKIKATALICGIEPDILLADVGMYGVIYEAATWLFEQEPPHPAQRLETLTHQGVTYRFVGDLHKINAGQLEALLDFIAENAAAPVLSAPHLLAVLFMPVDAAEQSAEVVSAAAEAFASLPVSVAWPVLLDFLRSGASAALHIRNSSALHQTTAQLLTTIEQAVSSPPTAGGSFTLSLKLRRSRNRLPSDQN